jgi:tetratricopeptide (TPR) repeat protein
VEYRLIQGSIGLLVLGAVVVFTLFPQVKPDWIQIGSGREGPRATNAVFSGVGAFDDSPADEAFELGAAYFLKEEWDKAIKEFNTALRLDPEDAEAYFFRGLCWQSKEELVKALADFDAALKLEPDNLEALLSRAETKVDLKQTDAALADLDAALRLAPDDIDALCLRGKVREEAGDYRAALADYQQANRLAPEDPLPLNNVAWVLCTAPDDKLRDGQRAVKAAMRAVELDGGEDWITLDTMAAACAEIGKFEAALRCQADAIRHAPPEEQEDLKARLELYRAKKPYRLSAAH